MDFYFFHLMPWPHLPADYNGPAWVDVLVGFVSGR